MAVLLRGERVFGGTPKLPIGAVSNPIFPRFREPEKCAGGEIFEFTKYDFQIRKASSGSDFNGKMQLCLERRIRNIKTEEFCLGQTVFFGQLEN